MLYLEDYLEMIEHLPQELRDRFTEMRELDLAVQNNMDSLDKKSRIFFQQCKRGELQHESMDTEFHSLRREYFKVMEDGDEKVAIATQIHELVERYLRRLDSELFKFKCELEADNNGITEILEKRSLELDGNSSAATALLLSINQKENRYYGASPGNSLGVSVNSAAGIITSTGNIGTGTIAGSNSGINALSNLSSVQLAVNAAGHLRHRKLEKRRETICTVPVQEKRANLNHSLPTVSSANISTGNHINSSLTTNTTTTHVTLPVSGGGGGGSGGGVNSNSSGTAVGNSVAIGSSGTTVMRQLPTSLTAHGVLNSNAAAAAVSPAASHASTTTVTYNLPQLGGGAAASSAIAAAASQAIVATQQMQQGRRTASLKASYEAIHGAGVAGGSEFWSSAASVAAQSNMQPTTTTLGNSSSHHHHHHQEKKQKKKLNTSISMPGGITVQSLGGSSSGNSITSSSSSMSVDSVDMLSNASSAAISNLSHGSLTLNPVASAVAASHASTTTTVVVAAPNVNSVTPTAIGLPSTALAPGANLTISENGLVVEQTNEGEWSYDPNEPRYCTCNQVSYGDMVACDNDACPYEWFHYPCVGITQPPKGKWYCPKCTASMRRRGNRKN